MRCALCRKDVQDTQRGYVCGANTQLGLHHTCILEHASDTVFLDGRDTLMTEYALGNTTSSFQFGHQEVRFERPADNEFTFHLSNQREVRTKVKDGHMVYRPVDGGWNFIGIIEKQKRN